MLIHLQREIFRSSAPEHGAITHGCPPCLPSLNRVQMTSSWCKLTTHTHTSLHTSDKSATSLYSVVYVGDIMSVKMLHFTTIIVYF